MAAKPIKILHVVFTLETGGMENGLVNVARGLAAPEFTIAVGCLEKSGPFAARLPQPENVTALGKPPGISFRTASRLAGLIKQVNPDVLHTHGFGPLVYTAMATGMGRSRPIIHGEHGMLYPEEQRAFHRLTRQTLYRCCRRIHTVSHGLKRHYVQHGFPARRLEVIVNGVDTGRFAPSALALARQRIGLAPAGAVIGIVGSYSARKRHGLLFAAFDQLAAERQDIRLLVVGGGSGPEAQQVLEQARASRATDRIRLAGLQENPVTYYQAMDILVVPSINEGLSNAALEAMACGIPVLAHDACGNADVIADGVDGFVGKIDTAEELSGKLKMALRDMGQLTLMGRSAREKMVKQFSLAGMVSEYRKMYLEVAQGNR